MFLKKKNPVPQKSVKEQLQDGVGVPLSDPGAGR